MKQETNKINRLASRIFAIGYLITNLLVLYKLILGKNIFDKYKIVTDITDLSETAGRVYYAKALYLLTLILFNLFHGNFYSSLAWSTLIYSILMIVLFGVSFFTILYLTGGIILIITFYIKYPLPVKQKNY